MSRKVVDTVDVEFVEDKTFRTHKVTIERSAATLDALKAEARRLFNYEVADAECEPGHGLRLLYPKDGLPALDGAGPGSSTSRRSLHHRAVHRHYSHLVDLKDGAKWAEVAQSFRDERAERRDKALVDKTVEAAAFLRPTMAMMAPLPLACLGAARRIAGIYGGNDDRPRAAHHCAATRVVSRRRPACRCLSLHPTPPRPRATPSACDPLRQFQATSRRCSGSAKPT